MSAPEPGAAAYPGIEGSAFLVTGASRGIGLAIAEAAARAGAHVMITARKQHELDAAAERLAGLPGRVVARVAHAGDPEAARDAVAACLEAFGRLDHLVNNAATNPYAGPVIDAPLPAWDKTFEVNLRGPLVWTQEAWKQALREHGGSVVNIASIGGYTGGGPIGVYDITKAAMVFMTRHLATELGPRVRVNGVAPGLVKTDFAKYLWEGAGADATYPWPLQRLGLPEDVAPAVLWLASGAASWVTGHTLVVDGGALAGSSTGG